MKRAQEEWNHDIVYDIKGNNDLYVCIGILYDFRGHDPKGHGDLCFQFDLVRYPKMSQGH